MILVDKIFSIIIEGSTIILIIFALIKDLITKLSRNNLSKIVNRSDKSWSYLIVAYNVFSIFLIGTISVSAFFANYRLIIIFFNLIITFYLCFWNNWFRNIVVGFFSKVQGKKEEH